MEATLRIAAPNDRVRTTESFRGEAQSDETWVITLMLQTLYEQDEMMEARFGEQEKNSEGSLSPERWRRFFANVAVILSYLDQWCFPRH